MFCDAIEAIERIHIHAGVRPQCELNALPNFGVMLSDAIEAAAFKRERSGPIGAIEIIQVMPVSNNSPCLKPAYALVASLHLDGFLCFDVITEGCSRCVRELSEAIR